MAALPGKLKNTNPHLEILWWRAEKLNGIGWRLSRMAEKRRYAIVYSIINQGIIYLILIFSIAVVAALLFATRITKPIKF